ncbi:MAG TPA: STAS domain-containing protein [Gemmataceae bacterium]|nr:STAS domain-containing protein [Gemmataceae bacterium]
MSFHFCAHAWEVRDIDDGTLVLLSQRDLEMATAGMLVDDLVQIVHESGQPNLYLDFSKVQQIPNVILGKMFALDQRLREHGGRLIVLGLRAEQYEVFESMRLTEKLDVRRV